MLDLVLTGTYGRLGLLKSPGKKERQAALEALEQVGLADFTKRQISQLSGGQLQRVFVARAIVQQADIMILDEPFVGIDMKSEQEIMAILNQWRDAGKTLIVVHHDLNKVSNYFDELVVMNHGIIAEGPVEEVYTAQNIERAFSGRSFQRAVCNQGRGERISSLAEFFTALGKYDFLQSALITAIMVGIMSGLIGSFIILRGMSLMGDAISMRCFRALPLLICWVSTS